MFMGLSLSTVMHKEVQQSIIKKVKLSFNKPGRALGVPRG